MQYARLGATGLEVSRICLGMMSYGSPDWRPWVLDEAASEPFVVRALEAGITFFDTADMYSDGESERVTGRLLRRHVEDREQVVVATKCWFPWGDWPNAGGLSRKHVLAAVDRSLDRLGLDYVDLFQVHRFDPHTPVEETMDALNTCVEHGKVRYLGASSMWAWQFAKLQVAADRNGFHRFVSMQPHLNLAYREEEREMLPQCRDMGVGVIPWSPLARGALARPNPTGDDAGFGAADTARAGSDHLMDRFYADAQHAIVDAVGEVAEARGVSRAQVALAWVLQVDGVTAPIVGATKLGHLDDAVAAVDLELTPEEVERLEAPYRPRAVQGHA